MTADATASFRRGIYGLIGMIAIGIGFGKLAGAENVFEPSRYAPPTPSSYGANRTAALTPTRTWPTVRPEPTLLFSSNDKSRWATVKALVEEGTYVIGQRDNPQASRDYKDAGIIFRSDFQSLDKVMNPATGEFFSSKPPLLPTLVAGLYYLQYHGLGWTFDTHRWPVVVSILMIINVLPFAIYLMLLARLIESIGRTDLGRVFAFSAAACGTFLTPFLTTFSNHVIASCFVLFAVYLLVRPRATGQSGEAFAAGLCAGFAAVCDLPALALAGGLFVPLAFARPATGLTFLGGVLVPVLALLICNHQALGTLMPAYNEFGGPWYEYAGSEWAKIKATTDPTGKGLDYAQAAKEVYAFHLMLGHHGWFSLTPVMLIGLIGLTRLAFSAGLEIQKAWGSRRAATGPLWTPHLIALLTVLISLVVFGFYIVRTTNYGGNTSGPRWLMWLTPLWVLAMVPAADRLCVGKLGRGFLGLTLGVSVFSVSYPAWNPWRSPWLLQLGEQTGYLAY